MLCRIIKNNIIGTLNEFKNCSLYVLAAATTVLAKVKPEFLPRQIGLLFEQKENCALLGSRQRVVAIPCRPFETTYRSRLQQSGPFLDPWPLNMGPIGCLETSVRNCHHSLRNNSEDRSSHLLRGGSLKSHRLTFVEINISVWKDVFVRIWWKITCWGYQRRSLFICIRHKTNHVDKSGRNTKFKKSVRTIYFVLSLCTAVRLPLQVSQSAKNSTWRCWLNVLQQIS